MGQRHEYLLYFNTLFSQLVQNLAVFAVQQKLAQHCKAAMLQMEERLNEILYKYLVAQN